MEHLLGAPVGNFCQAGELSGSTSFVDTAQALTGCTAKAAIRIVNQLFPKHYRVLSGEDFTRILRRGCCAADGMLVLYALASRSESAPRLGVTIPKKTGPAVVRNQWKRLIREAYRTQREQLPPGFDFVVRPKKGGASQMVMRFVDR